ncbi:Ger(x)C family spore germination protein [Clostridium formicaceticum]|uniref:Spore germination protein A3 n=1 Tax=Clostridium formicaceticum TaxID=1497 RepID=A0AAC9RN83_9CLOT|nr:Ger(x)C family spore germination protein [Clostridium formicaceticum]AOY78051.1 spore gernimation protein [Clostridium formicaceticum]ARE88687.1 Spore germination protein A3 precursor [Clostridium formicaceticum]
MRKIAKLLAIILLVFPLIGCWDSTNLENLLIVYGLGIDISQENPEQYFFTIGFPTIIPEAPENKHEVSTEAPSLGKAKSNFQQKVYRQISYDNIRVVIFSEKVAKEGIMVHVDAMLREPLYRGTTRFAVFIDKAVDLLAMEPPVSLFVSTFIFDAIEQNHQSTVVPISTLRSFSHEYYSDGIEPSMPFICYGADDNELNVGCVALFQGDKLIERLRGRNSRSFMLLKGEIQRGIYTFELMGGFVSLNLKGGKSKIKTKIIDGELHIFQDIFINSVLAEHTPKHNMLENNKIEELETQLAREIKNDLKNVLEILQNELKNDNIGYGKYVKANHPEYFDAENWNHQFSKAIIHINPNVRIRTLGVTP